MNTFYNFTCCCFALLLSFQLNAQIDNSKADMNFKLRLMDDQVTWGVFVVPGESVAPSKRANTGSGQVTIVAPAGFVYAALENHGGTWIENARVDGPMEAPENAYISFGFVMDEPRIKYFSGKETLLFTFVPEDVNAEISLIDNQNDPFAAPNTYGTNPGNDLGVIDFAKDGGVLAYSYGHNLNETTSQFQPKAAFASKKAASANENEMEYKAVFASEKIAAPSN